MAEPKKKLSKTRTHQRRANYKVGVVSVKLCSNCGEAVMPHTVCRGCGFYKGKSVIGESPTKRIVLEQDEKK